MERNKKRFEFLSDYYLELLDIAEEIKKGNGVIQVSVGVEKTCEFSTGKIEGADNVFKVKFNEMISGMMKATEDELKHYINKL